MYLVCCRTISTPNIRALIYKNDKTWPSIVGDYGRIVEYELLDGMLNFLGGQEEIHLLGNIEDSV